MAFRRLFYRWLWLAVLVLPLWLLVGWGVFQAGGWAFLWVLFIAIPSVFIGQLVLAGMVRARPSVAADRAVSWTDVATFGAWHALTIAVGFYDPRWFPAALALAIAAGVVTVWLTMRQLWREAGRPSERLRGAGRAGGAGSGAVVVIRERREP